MELTDEQWKFIEPFLPKPEVRADGRGRPWRDPRDVFNGILWILKTGARWKDLPERFPPYQTCHRRYQEWVKNGVAGFHRFDHPNFTKFDHPLRWLADRRDAV